jgi:branched-chain amino acid transport system ATP-binding protein
VTSAVAGATQASGGPHDGARLEARGLSITFGGLAAVDDVDLELAQGEILGLIGPNGAGKTTLVNGLSGFQDLTAGSVRLNGEDITNWPPHRRARAGLTRTFQQVRLFMELSALDNIQAAAVGVGERSASARRVAWRLLRLFDLEGKEDVTPSALPYGDERRLSVARSLACRPALLLIDEPAAGLNEAETRMLSDELAALPAEYGCGMLVIEHDMSLIMSLCERIQVLNFGRTIAVGTPAEVRANPDVIEAYLGTDEEAADDT